MVEKRKKFEISKYRNTIIIIIIFFILLAISKTLKLRDHFEHIDTILSISGALGSVIFSDLSRISSDKSEKYHEKLKSKFQVDLQKQEIDVRDQVKQKDLMRNFYSGGNGKLFKLIRDIKESMENSLDKAERNKEKDKHYPIYIKPKIRNSLLDLNEFLSAYEDVFKNEKIIEVIGDIDYWISTNSRNGIINESVNIEDLKKIDRLVRDLMLHIEIDST